MYKYKGKITEFRELPLGIKLIAIMGKKRTKKVLRLMIITTVMMVFMVSASAKEDDKTVSVFNYSNEDIVRVGKVEKVDIPESSDIEIAKIESVSKEVNSSNTIKISQEELDKQLEYQDKKEEDKTKKFELALKENDSETIEHDPELVSDKNIKITEKEIELIAMVVWGEAGNQSYEGKKAVASVVINRLTSGYYGKNVKELIYMGNGSQFNCVRGSKFGKYTEEDLQAVRDVLYINPYPDNMYYYANIDLVYEKGMDVGFADLIEKNIYVKIDDHTFSLGKKGKKNNT